MKKLNILISILAALATICALVTLICFQNGVGVTADYNGKTIGHWSTSLLVFGGDDGLQTIGKSTPLVLGFVLALLALIAGVATIVLSFFEKTRKFSVIPGGLSGIMALIAGIQLLNIKNLAVNGDGKALFVNSAYSGTFENIQTAGGPVTGGVFGILGLVFAVATVIVTIINIKKQH